MVLSLTWFVAIPRVGSIGWSNPTQLVTNMITNGNPVISQDGSKVVYQGFGNPLPGPSQIFIVKSDGTGMVQLTNNGVGSLNASNFSPSTNANGSRIVFFSNAINVAKSNYQIFSMNVDGTYPCASPLRGTGCLLAANLTSVNTYPVISADGSTVAFQSNRTGSLHIWAMKSDGTQLGQLSTGPTRDQHASISVDGSKVAFQSNVTAGGQIFTVNSDSTGLLRLTNNNCGNRYPVISGDGRFVVFQSDCSGTWQIIVTGSDGVQPCTSPVPGTGCQVTHNQAVDQLPTTSYNGSLIVWMGNESLPMTNSNPKGYYQIFSSNQDGSNLYQLTANSAYDGNPSVDGAGDKIVYQSDVNGTNTQLYLITRVVARDVAVTGMTLQTIVGKIYLGSRLNGTVTISDPGDYPETLNLTVYWNSTMPIMTRTGLALASGASSNITFTWDTSGLKCGVYRLSAAVSSVPGETYLLNNAVNGPAVSLSLWGDVNGDHRVDIVDLASVGAAFGTIRGQPSYNPAADINSDGVINIVDLVLVAGSFGQLC